MSDGKSDQQHHERQQSSTPTTESSPSLESVGAGTPGGALLKRKISRRLARKANGNGMDANASNAIDKAASSSGSPLPAPLQNRFEQSLGADLSGVRVHTGAASAEAARSVGAQAFATGKDVHFAEGKYDPSSSAGQHLIAHEVAHTVQQSGGHDHAPQHKLEVSEPGDAHEREADRAADAMLAGQRASVSHASGVMRQVAPPGGGNAHPSRAGRVVAAIRRADQRTIRLIILALERARAQGAGGVELPDEGSFEVNPAELPGLEAQAHQRDRELHAQGGPGGPGGDAPAHPPDGPPPPPPESAHAPSPQGAAPRNELPAAVVPDQPQLEGDVATSADTPLQEIAAFAQSLAYSGRARGHFQRDITVNTPLGPIIITRYRFQLELASESTANVAAHGAPQQRFRVTATDVSRDTQRADGTHSGAAHSAIQAELSSFPQTLMEGVRWTPLTVQAQGGTEGGRVALVSSVTFSYRGQQVGQFEVNVRVYPTPEPKISGTIGPATIPLQVPGLPPMNLQARGTMDAFFTLNPAWFERQVIHWGGNTVTGQRLVTMMRAAQAGVSSLTGGGAGAGAAGAGAAGADAAVAGGAGGAVDLAAVGAGFTTGGIAIAGGFIVAGVASVVAPLVSIAQSDEYFRQASLTQQRFYSYCASYSRAIRGLDPVGTAEEQAHGRDAAERSIREVMERVPGATREQVIQHAVQLGGEHFYRLCYNAGQARVRAAMRAATERIAGVGEADADNRVDALSVSGDLFHRYSSQWPL